MDLCRLYLMFKKRMNMQSRKLLVVCLIDVGLLLFSCKRSTDTNTMQVNTRLQTNR